MLCFLSSFFLLYLLLMEFLESGDISFESSRTFLPLLSVTAFLHLCHFLITLSFTRLLILLLIAPAILIFKSRKFIRISLIFLALAVLLNLSGMMFERELFLFASSFISIFIFTFLLSYLELFGWADAKAFWTVAIVFPSYPEISKISHFPSLLLAAPEIVSRIILLTILLSSLLYLLSRILKKETFFFIPILFASFFSSFGSFPMTVFMNSIIINLVTLLLPLFYFTRNLLRGERPPKKLMILYAFPVEIDKLLEEERRRRRGYSRFKILEIIHEGELISSYRGFDYDEKDLIELRKRRERVWATYGIPFIVPITAGLIFAILRGDLLIEILRRV
ncbi:MAG: archaeal preflagellin peptidase FlaK [Archaeoglobi archaeon]|nr:archaeal preflagellin peptidase FlaK [Archaeoglobi archaeon]